RLRLPPATNDVDYSTIFDVRLVLYFLCMHDPQLEADIRATFPASGEAAQGFSARLHAPDEYFVFGPGPDGTDTITFSLDPRAFPFNQRNLQITELGVLVLRDRGQDPPEAFNNGPLTVTMGGVTASGTTDASGVIHTDGGAGDLAAFIGQGIENVAVMFTGPDAARA
ncbi:MAG: hypothetical protein GY778_28465, partial [bacterium]|nr:hypothetical protein [bacterium]